METKLVKDKDGFIFKQYVFSTITLELCVGYEEPKAPSDTTTIFYADNKAYVSCGSGGIGHGAARVIKDNWRYT